MKDHRFIMICAFRYALGRGSYAPSVVIEYLQSHLQEFTESDKALIVREIHEYFDRIKGNEMQKDLWLSFANAIL